MGQAMTDATNFLASMPLLSGYSDVRLKKLLSVLVTRKIPAKEVPTGVPAAAERILQ